MTKDRIVVNYKLEVTKEEGIDSIKKKSVGTRIRVLAAMKGEKMARWARDLGVSRWSLYDVVDGRRKTKYIRKYIQEKLGVELWSE